MDFLIGVGYSFYMETEDQLNVSLKARKNDFYISLQAEEARIEELGQGMGDARIYSLTVGYEAPVSDKVYVFGEFGWGELDADIKPNIQTEMVYTHLVANHAVPGHEIPVRERPNIGETNGVHTDYSLDSGILGKIGLKVRLSPHLETSVSYRFFRPEEHWKLWDDEYVARTGGWWQENTTRDLSSLEFKVEYNF